MPLARRVIILLKVLGVFLLMGPPVGAVTFFFAMGVYEVSQTGDVAGMGVLALFGLIYGLPLSYLVGIVPATVSGFILGATAALYRVPGLGFSAATGVLVGLWLIFLGGGSDLMSSSEAPPDTVPATLLVTTCLVATVLCWAVARCTLGGPRSPVPPSAEQDGSPA